MCMCVFYLWQSLSEVQYGSLLMCDEMLCLCQQISVSLKTKDFVNQSQEKHKSPIDQYIGTGLRIDDREERCVILRSKIP